MPKKGDMVRLNSGGPPMQIVSGPCALEGKYVYCSWVAEGKIMIDLFPVASVSPVVLVQEEKDDG